MHEIQTDIRPGGSLASAVDGQYDFDIFDVVAEGLRRTKGLKRITLLDGLAVAIAISAISVVLGVILGTVADIAQPGVLTQLVMQLALIAIVYPFLVGFLMTGIRQAVDLPITFNTPFSYFAKAGPVIVGAILLSLLSTIGFFLLVIPGIYLSVAYLFALPLIVEKDLDPWTALEASRKAATAHWFKIFGLFIVLTVLVALGFVTVIGWIWAIPLWYAAYGVLYRTVFGVEEVRADTAA